MKRLTKTRQIALCGLTAAGSLALLWMACAVPSGRIGLTAAAGGIAAAVVFGVVMAVLFRPKAKR